MKRRLQFAPRFMQLVAIGSRWLERMPTVRFIDRRTDLKGPTMNATTKQVRMFGMLFAVLMSTMVLGGTVAAMQSGSHSETPLVVLERVTINASAVN
jgi:hypothetical protein